MSLVAGLAGALAFGGVASAAPHGDALGGSGSSLQIAAAYGLGPSVSQEEMALPAGSGINNLIVALANILPGAGPDPRINAIGTESVGDRILANDAAEGANVSLRFLCPDRLYHSDTAWSNHTNANCDQGGTALLPNDTVPTTIFVRFGPTPPTSPPPGGTPIPMPCGATALSFYTSSVMNSVPNSTHTSNGVIH